MNKQKIKVNNSVLYKSKTIEVRGDIIVPDVKPDIVNIINSNGNVYIYKKEITTSRVRVDGNLDTHIIYLADNGETRSIQTTLNFIETIEDGSITEEMFFDYELNIQKIETKILNERKISIVAVVELNGIFKKIDEVEILENISEITDVEKLEENIKIKNLIGINNVKTTLKENISIDSNDEIAEILKTNINIINSETKISYNKILAKAEASIEIMYLTEDDRINMINSIFPVMSFIDLENVKEENECKVEYKIKNMLFTQNSKEQNSISVQIEFEVECEVFENKEIKVIQDIYGLKNDIECKEKLVNVNICEEKEKDVLNIEEKVFVEDINKIIDIDCFPKIVDRKTLNNIINYEGEIIINILYEVDNRRGLCSKEIKIPFTLKKENSQKIKLNITKKEFSLSNENINLFLEMEITEIITQDKQIKLIEEINIKEKTDEEIYSMIVYFIKPEDTLWNIGKKFKVSIGNICKYNNIENLKIIPGNKLYIVR